MEENQEQVFTSLSQLVKSIESASIRNWFQQFKACTTLEQFILLKGKVLAYEEIVDKVQKPKAKDEVDND